MVSKEDRLHQIKYVVENSKDVKIDMKKLNEYSKTLKINENTYWLNERTLGMSEKEYILFVFLVESMNFCFWKEPYIQKTFEGNYYKRSAALFYAMLDKVITNKNFLNINTLVNIQKENLALILGGNHNIPFLDERYNNLMETIQIIHKKGNQFYKEIFSFKSSNELLNYIVSQFPSFNDTSKYEGKEICFYKRATLLVRDLFEISNTVKNNIKDIDDLLGGADYIIPRVLRHYGILKYSKRLSDIIDNKSLVLKDSTFEVEIRSNMLYVLELLKEKLHKRNIAVNSIVLDNIIWITGRGINVEHHRTETIYY